jgi:hypothetical protein
VLAATPGLGVVKAWRSLLPTLAAQLSHVHHRVCGWPVDILEAKPRFGGGVCEGMVVAAAEDGGAGN